MKNTLRAVLFAAAVLTASSPLALAANVDVSINIGQPGYYGPLDIRDYGRPQLIYSEPRIIERVSTQRQPVYLRVPPGHAKNWRKHCSKYNACGERVYFVRDSWYEREYVPRYQAEHHDRRDEYRDNRREYRYEKHHDKKGHGKNH